MKKSLLLICGLLCLSNFTGCKKEKDSSPALKDKTKRTVLAYMFQDTNLWKGMIGNINDMERGWDPTINGTMLVYVDASTSVTQFDGKPVLLEIQHDTTNLIVSKIVKTYPDTDATNSDVFLQVQQDVIAMYPAESYGLVLSGHADGFLITQSDVSSKGIHGSDRWSTNKLDIDVIAKNVATHYDFIIFDACLMAESASLYQLRKATDFVVAAVEVFSDEGFGFRSDTKALFTQPKADLYSFGKGTMDYYQNTVKGQSVINPSFYLALGVYRMAAMEKLAEVTKKSIEKLNIDYKQLHVEINKIIGSPGLQSSMYYPQLLDIKRAYYYDLGLLPMLLQSRGEELLAAQLNLAIASAVMQRHFAFSNGFLKDNENYPNYSANISFYIPTINPIFKYQDSAFYDRFEWSAASGFTNKWE